MYANRLVKIGGLCLIAAWISSCMATPGPKGWLPSPKEALSDTFGAWMIVEYSSEAGNKTAEGEFIALEKYQIYLLTGYGLETISTINVQHVTLAVYKEERIARTWTLLGFLSTASHGYYAAASAPLWLLIGIYNASAESTSGITDSDVVDWDEIQKYARFPQGIPQGVDLRQLKRKPYK
jgi:hypothetical protein